ncbi:protein CUSTOS isoform X1 [Manis pentadactyla]|uniref:protein CUSTOS isoform X1 n=1 Tax=Manis pentadactyla TaxID=143292 RepID=UPI00187396E8|nr:protein CUSTOS isoform X1 [Manis pentadactyla]
MAASNGSASDLESSGSDAEELARCREAAMPTWGLEQRPSVPEKPRAGATNNQLPATQLSLRRKVDEHDQDGNELQTTPEFRAHVAKKLGALLDSSISISEVVKEPTKAEVQRVTPEDDGFRLFFTSIPGDPKEKVPPQPRRKRLPSSSSSEDSEEEWQRCREAAVSASDLLQESALHGPVTVGKQAKRKKRNSTEKAKKEISADVATATTTTSGITVGKQEKGSPELRGDPASLGTKKKKRKKKTKASEVSLSPPAKRAAAVPTN